MDSGKQRNNISGLQSLSVALLCVMDSSVQRLPDA